MKKTWKKLSVMVLTGMLCMSTAPSAFAAAHTAGSGKSVLSQYHADLANQRSELSRLINDSKELTQEVKAAQHTVKEAGRITKSNCDKIAEYSKAIKEKRVALTALRGNNKDLRADAKDARLAGEMNVAEDALKDLQDLQDEQIDLRTEIVKLLQEKLDFLNSIKAGTDVAADSTSTTDASSVTDETAAADGTTATGETIAADETTVTGETVSTDGTTVTDETVSTDETTVTGETASTDGTAVTGGNTTNEEIVTDEATLAAAFDDGAELEQD